MAAPKVSRRHSRAAPASPEGDKFPDDNVSTTTVAAFCAPLSDDPSSFMVAVVVGIVVSSVVLVFRLSNSRPL